jgi:hypothetical protein
LVVAAFDESGTQTSTSGIQGTKWNDLNGNGVKDAGEPGLAGWTIYIDQNNNGKLDSGEKSTTTDANGNYSFTNLEPGTYTLAEVQRPGWQQTSPGSVSNGSFETGNFTGWNTLGSTNVQTTVSGINPTQGTYQAVISNGGSSVTDSALESFLGLSTGALDGMGNGNATQGSAIKLSPITVAAGTTVTFDWDFLTGEATPSSFYNDFAFVSIKDLSELADTNSTFVTPPGSVKQTGYKTFSYTFTTAGTYAIGLGVVDVGDSTVDSTLLVDKVSLSPNGVQVVNLASGQTVNNIDFGNKALSLLAESNDTIPLAFDTALSNGSGTFKNAGVIGDNPNVAPNLDVDFIKFQLNAGEKITIDIDAAEIGSSLDAVLRLFDAAGNKLAISDDAPAPGELFSLDPYITFTATTSGTYYVAVSGFKNLGYNPLVEGSGIAGSTGNYNIELNVSASNGVLNDPQGDMFGVGSNQPDIQSVSGTLSGDNLIFSMNFFTPVVAPSTGSSQAIGGYLDLDLDQNASTGAPSYQSIFAPSGQKGGLLGDEALIDLFSEQLHPGFVDVLDRSSFTSLGLAAITYGSNSLQIQVPLSVLGDDGALNYGAVIGTFSQPTDAAPNTVVGTVGATSSSGLLKEPNDTLSQAIATSGLIPSGTDSFKTPGIIGDNPNVVPGLDVDFIKIDLTKGDQLNVDIDTIGLKSSLDSVLRLFDSAGNQVAFNDDAVGPGETSSLDSYLDFTATASGTYYLAVSGYGNSSYNPFVQGSGTTGSTGNYNLEISVKPDPAAPQVVYLDFVSDQNPGEYAYTATEQEAIVQNLQKDYQNFNLTFTLAKPTSGKYSSLIFNANGIQGGLADGIDFRNLNRNDKARINFNGLLGGSGEPALNSANVVALSSTIAAHELGHLLGLRHGDSYGPIGSGIHNPPFYYTPAYPGPTDANETTIHTMASPASVGQTLNEAVGDTFFGEREAVKLAFNEKGTVVSEQAGNHSSIATAQALTLSSLKVPNTLVSGKDVGKDFQVQALDVTGSLKGSGEADYYSFEGKAGQIFNFEVISSILAPKRIIDSIDSQISIFDSNGNLVPYYTSTAFNDNELESSDSIIIDLKLPADGTYYIKVNAATPSDTGNYELFMYQFAATDTSNSGSSVNQFAGVGSAASHITPQGNARLSSSDPFSVSSSSAPCLCSTCLKSSGSTGWSGMIGSSSLATIIGV